MKLAPQSTDPPLIKWAKYVAIIAVALGFISSYALSAIRTGVLWAIEPKFKALEATRSASDSTFYTKAIGEIQAVKESQRHIIRALRYPIGSEERIRALDRAMGVRERRVYVPEAIQDPENNNP